MSFGDEELMGKFKRGGGWGGWNSRRVGVYFSCYFYFIFFIFFFKIYSFFFFLGNSNPPSHFNSGSSLLFLPLVRSLSHPLPNNNNNNNK